MNREDATHELVKLGILALGQVQDPARRAALLEAGADLLGDEELATQCRVTARCIQASEAAQLSLFHKLSAV